MIEGSTHNFVELLILFFCLFVFFFMIQTGILGADDELDELLVEQQNELGTLEEKL